MQLPQEFKILQTIPGFGFVIPLTVLYEIEDISRFKTVGDFLSYARLVKCTHNSADKKASGGHNKIGIAETNEAEAKSKKGEKQKMSFTIKKSLIKERIYPFTEPNATPATIYLERIK